MLLLLKQERRSPAHQSQNESSSNTREHHALLCRRCGSTVSDQGALFAMNGESPVRVFANPHGLLCEILTLSRAQGLTLASPPTSEFTWFPGYAWEVAYCATCRAHLGWAYSTVAGGEPAHFYGLLRAELSEG